MSVSSKVFVTCGKESMFDIINTVVNTLNIFSRELLDEYVSEKGLANRIRYEEELHEQKYSNGCHFFAYDADVISFIFGSGDTFFRNVKMLCNCSGDYKDIYDGDKIIFSLGSCGKSKEIVNILCAALVRHGDVYYDYDDCDDVYFQKFKGKI